MKVIKVKGKGSKLFKPNNKTKSVKTPKAKPMKV